MSKRDTVLLDVDVNRRFFDVISELIDPATGAYHLPESNFLTGLRKVWQHGASGRRQLVAVIDSGIDSSHVLLRNAVVDSVNFTLEESVHDELGHGTLVALLIRYVAPNARLLNVKALDRTGRGSEEALVSALHWAREHHATVVNVSVGIPQEDPLRIGSISKRLRNYCAKRGRKHWLVYSLRRHWMKGCPVCDAADRLRDAHINVVAAVGNNPDEIYCPGRGRRKDILVVGAASVLSGQITVPGYSGRWPDLVAPELPAAEGTSFSAPLVAGSLCLLTETGETLIPQYTMSTCTSIKARGDFFFDRGYWVDAIDIYNLVLDKNGHLLRHKRKKTTTRNCAFCKALVYPIRTRLGLAYMQNKAFSAALEQFKENIAIAPVFSGAHMNLGAAYRNLGRFDAAIEAFTTALKYGHDDPEIYMGLGDTYVLAGSSRQAISSYESALRIKPLLPRALRQLVTLYKAEGQKEKVQGYLQTLQMIESSKSKLA